MKYVYIILLLLFPGIAQALDSTHCLKGCPNGSPSTNDVIQRPIYVLSNNGTTKFTDWGQDRLGGYVKLSVSERREVVKELTEEGESTRAIGEVLGVTNTTVARDLSVTNVTPPIDTLALLAATDKVRETAEQNKPHIANNSGENEWYTPAHLIESARIVMGSSDTSTTLFSFLF